MKLIPQVQLFALETRQMFNQILTVYVKEVNICP